jgi:hypothetical protein
MERVYLRDLEGTYWRIPYLDLGLPPISLWELQEARRRLKDKGRLVVDEHAIFEAIRERFQVGGDPNAESALFVCIVVCAVPLNALVPLMRERCRRNSVSQPSSHVQCRSSAIDNLKPARRFVTETYSQQKNVNLEIILRDSLVDILRAPHSIPGLKANTL